MRDFPDHNTHTRCYFLHSGLWMNLAFVVYTDMKTYIAMGFNEETRYIKNTSSLLWRSPLIETSL